jgi:hypothetical protein
VPRKATKLLKTDLDKMLKRARKDPSHSEIRADGAAPGLNAQAREGRLIWKFRYLSPTTRARRTVTIGDYPELTLAQAQGEAGEYRKQVAAGLDPLERKVEEERSALTLKEAVKLYLDDLQERAESGTSKRGKRSGYSSAKRRLETNVLPKLGARRVLDVTSEDVRRWHRGMKDRPVEPGQIATPGRSISRDWLARATRCCGTRCN